MRRRIAAWWLALLLAPAAARAGGTVTACASEGQAGAGLNLRDAVTSGGVVNFACAAGTVLRVSHTLQLTAPIEIDGGAVVELFADPKVPMFAASPSADVVVLRRLALGGARSVTSGGIFFGVASTLRLIDVTIERVGRSSGSVFGFAGGVVIRANEIEVEQCRFRENAGAVLLAPHLTVRKSEFVDNPGQPFMPDFVDDGADATIEESLFRNNGVSVWRGWSSIRDSSFISNGRGSPAFGGALLLRGTATVEKSTFLKNRAPNGAAIWLASGDLNLRRVTFDSNTATQSGGAIGVAGNTAPTAVVVRHSHFRSNRAGTGGAIAFQRTGEAPRMLRGFAVNFAYNQASANGGAIDAPSAEVQLARVQFVDNQAGGRGGAVYGGDDFSRTILANALAVRNAAAAGALYSGLRLELINATVADNASGGAVALLADVQAWARFKNTVFLRNAGGSCSALPGGETPTFSDDGHNVQFPGAECGAGVRVIDPRLDGMYVPVPDSPVRFAGDTPACLSDPVNARDLFNARRPQAGNRCTIGAIESTIEPYAFRLLCRSDAPGRLADLFALVCGGRPRAALRAPDQNPR